MEKLFVTRLDDFIEKQNLLTEHQYRLRSNRSTAIAVMDLIEQISTAMDNKKYTVGVFIDLKKAFDTIDHTLLMQKIERYGIRRVAYSWLRDYLDNRQQYVQLDSIKSDLQ